MTIKQLSYFSKIYESGSLSKAADALYISQQALSRILGSLEQEFGVPLFTRGRNGIRPTGLGTELYRSSQKVLREMSALEEHIQTFLQPDSGRLTIGLAAGTRYFNTINTRSVWHEFQNQHPQISIHAQEYSYVEGLESLKNRRLDVLTFSDYDAGAEYLQFPLKTWGRVLLVPKGHPLYDKPFAEASDFQGEHIVFCANPQVYQRFGAFCDVHDCRPAEVVRVSDTLYMYEACQSERCIGITISGYFSGAFLPQFPQLRTLPLKEEFLPYTVSALFRKDHPMGPAILELAGLMKAYLEAESGA